MTLKFSIIINTYNRGAFLKKTLASLLQLRHSDFEVIVVNGPSTDDTETILASYADIIKATPEFEELRRKRIESGSARYYHLMTQASERAVRAIIEVGRSSEFDLVAMKGYLATLEEPIEAADLTELVLRRLRNGGNAS